MKTLYTEQSHINGQGLFTAAPIKKHECVGYVHGPTHVIRHFTEDITKDTINWIGVGRYTWINTDNSLFRFINHSCKPNVAIVTKRKVIALTDIPANTEITMDYSLTEAQEDWEIEHCSCSAKGCRKRIQAIQFLPQHTFQKYYAYIPKNFVRLYKSTQRDS